ncbi:hypothetical protein [Marinobacter confluentis]|uniref:Uncharacterized protein n=1 Tax=Marinobacter confluentis TaxID=1697557 RepID=A0A4Z1CF43_9GAMM|nr:hypothetical protein [Marinobacter confluentis]TGN38674.1 hypothetical protein E5Q11_13075 [Marinobacter confluentis]
MIHKEQLTATIPNASLLQKRDFRISARHYSAKSQNALKFNPFLSVIYGFSALNSRNILRNNQEFHISRTPANLVDEPGTSHPKSRFHPQKSAGAFATGAE